MLAHFFTVLQPIKLSANWLTVRNIILKPQAYPHADLYFGLVHIYYNAYYSVYIVIKHAYAKHICGENGCIWFEFDVSKQRGVVGLLKKVFQHAPSYNIS